MFGFVLRKNETMVVRVIKEMKEAIKEVRPKKRRYYVIQRDNKNG